MFEGPDNQALAWPLCLSGSSSPQLLMWAGFRGYQLLREAEKVVWSCSQLPFHISFRPLAGRLWLLMLHCHSGMFFSSQSLWQWQNLSLSHQAAPQPHTCVHHKAAPPPHGGCFNCLNADQVILFCTFKNFTLFSLLPSLNISEPPVEMSEMVYYWLQTLRWLE